ncbi:MAG TPA: hypothetical protein VGL12_05040 [Roseiarcus sp.]
MAFIAFTRDPIQKEHFYAARESLLGVWQTGIRCERIVLVVRTAEDVVLGQPHGGIESRSAFCDRVPV